MINGTDINFNNILLDKKLYENISVYDIQYKISEDPKPLRIRFDVVAQIVSIIILKDQNRCIKFFTYSKIIDTH